MRANGFKIGVGTVFFLFAGCAAPEDDGATLEERAAILNGTAASAAFVSTAGMVAVYDRDGTSMQNWFSRPCSGTIVFADASSSWVLTARHCVTADGTVTGPLLPAGDFKLLSGTNPGPTVHSPTPTSPLVPPAAAVTANLLVASPVTASQQLDLALLRLPPNSWSSVVSAFPLLMAPVSGLNSAPVSITGYGVNNNDTNCHTDADAVGAGVARFASGFTVNTATSFTAGGGTFAFKNSSTPGGARVMCGDSGGGDYTPWPKSDPIVQTLIGVHSGAAVDGTANSTDTFSGAWISNVLDGLYLFQWGGGNVAWSSNMDLTVGLSAGPYFIYGETQKTVSVDFDDFSMCVQKRAGSSDHAMLVNCNGSAAQQWQVTADNRIRNPSTNTCLQASGTSIVVRTCVAGGSSATSRQQTWYWRGSPSDTD